MRTLLGEVVHKLRTLKEHQFLFFDLGPQNTDTEELLRESSKLIDELIKKIEVEESLKSPKLKRKNG